LRISDLVIARANRSRTRTRPLTVFGIAQHPPGVAPEGAGMAMDDTSGFMPALGWANNAFNSAFLEGTTFLGYAWLAELAQRPEYRRIVEVIATEMTRKWIRVTAKGDDDKTDKIEELNDALEKLNIKQVFREIAEQDGLFGRAHLYLDTGDGEDREELKVPIGNGRNEVSKSKVNKSHPLQALRTVEAVWCYPTDYNSNDPLRDDWYRPNMWYAMGKQIHMSRLIRFVGREVPDLLKPAYSFGGLALTQMAKPYVDNWLRTRQSISDLVHSFSVSGILTDLSTALTADGSEMFKRAELFNKLRDNSGLMLLNKATEEFFNVATPLSTLDQLQAQSQEQICSITGIPLVKYTGISPHGLNASSEGELRAFYDWIGAFQPKLFDEAVKTVLGFTQLSIWGEIDEDIVHVWEPLWEATEKEVAEIRKLEADTDQVLIDTGVLHPEESRKRIAADPETEYAALDVEDVPELKEEEEAGLAIKGAGGAEKAILAEGQGPSPAPSLQRDREEAHDQAEGLPNAGVFPFAHAHDAEWREGEHPRGQPGNAGQFGSGGSGAPGGEKNAPAPAPAPARGKKPTKAQLRAAKGPSKKDVISDLLTKGTTAKEVMAATGWPSVSMPAQAKAARMHLVKTKEDGKTVYRGVPMTDAEIAKFLPNVKASQKRGRGPAGRDPQTFSLLEFLAAGGGIKTTDPMVADLRTILGKKNLFVPGFGMLIRPKGDGLDKARANAVEGRYIYDPGFSTSAQATTTISTLLEQIENEVRGEKVYRMGMEGHESADEHQAKLDALDRDLDDVLDAVEIDPYSVDGKLRKRILQILDKEGVFDPLEAYERAVMEQSESKARDGKAKRIPDDIPDWDVPDDEPAAPRASPAAAPF
jgi:hypothetical protein